MVQYLICTRYELGPHRLMRNITSSADSIFAQKCAPDAFSIMWMPKDAMVTRGKAERTSSQTLFQLCLITGPAPL